VFLTDFKSLEICHFGHFAANPTKKKAKKSKGKKEKDAESSINDAAKSSTSTTEVIML